MDNTSA